MISEVIWSSLYLVKTTVYLLFMSLMCIVDSLKWSVENQASAQEPCFHIQFPTITGMSRHESENVLSANWIKRQIDRFCFPPYIMIHYAASWSRHTTTSYLCIHSLSKVISPVYRYSLTSSSCFCCCFALLLFIS